MSQSDTLKNQLLIAMPTLEDPNFSRTVTYICEHSDQGAMGIVLNRPTELSLADVLRHMDIEGGLGDAGGQMVFLGGPVEEERGFVLHSHTDPWAFHPGRERRYQRHDLARHPRGDGAR